MSEEGLSGLDIDGYLSACLCLPRYFLLAGRNLVALPIFSLTTLPVLTLTVMYFHSARLCIAFTTLVTASSLSLPSIWLPPPSPFLTCSGCPRLPLALPCSLCSYALENFIGFSSRFCHFTLITLHIHFSTPDSHPSCKQPVWDTLPILLSTSQMMILPTLLFQVPTHLSLKHYTSTLPLQVHNLLLINLLLTSQHVLPSPQQKTGLAQSLSIQITTTFPSHC